MCVSELRDGLERTKWRFGHWCLVAEDGITVAHAFHTSGVALLSPVNQKSRKKAE